MKDKAMKRRKEIDQLTRDIEFLLKGASPVTTLQIKNKLRRIRLASKGIVIPEKEDTLPASTPKQEKDRYIAQRAVLDALVMGEHITMEDAARFKVCDMHTIIARVRERIARERLPYTIESKRITFGNKGKTCKEYWLTINDETNNQQAI